MNKLLLSLLTPGVTLCFFVCLCTSPAQATARVTLQPAMNSLHDIAALVPNKSDVECRELHDIPRTYLCMAKSFSILRSLMGRISYFVESSSSRSLVTETNDEYTMSAQANYLGHDIQARDLELFFTSMDQTCRTENLCLNTYEQALRTSIIRDAQEKGYDNYVVIATFPSRRAFVTISHEIAHAHFFLNLNYREAVRLFWKTEVIMADQILIRQSLEELYGLNGEDGEFLMLNEFQAYLLQMEPESGKLAFMTDKYSARLRDHLKKFFP